TRTPIEIVVFDRSSDVAERQVEADEFGRIRLDVILLLKTAKRVDARDPRNGPELRPDDPILHRAQVGHLLKFSRKARALGGEIASIGLPAGFAIHDRRPFAWAPVMDRPHVNLTQPCGDWSHARLGALRQILLGLSQALVDLLASKIDVDVIVEDRGDLRESVARQ